VFTTYLCCLQAALLDAFGAELVPTFLGGQLDYEAVRQQWLDKMDAAIAQRQQHPRSKQVGGAGDSLIEEQLAFNM
jgi:hypothetical protein